MGRTIPSFRIAEAQELVEWKSYRKALPKKDRTAFDSMLSSARLYTSASSAAVRTSKFEGTVMAVVFHHYKMLAQCVGIVSETAKGGDR
jgi:hypothetical protein